MRQLPRDSAYSRSLRGERAYWDEGVELLAQSVDGIRELTYVLLRVNGNDARVLDPVPRPGAQAGPETVSLAQFAAFIEGGE